MKGACVSVPLDKAVALKDLEDAARAIDDWFLRESRAKPLLRDRPFAMSVPTTLLENLYKALYKLDEIEKAKGDDRH